MRVLAIIAGIVLLLPGLCTLGFGFMFTQNGLDGLGGLVVIWFVIGGLLTWAGVYLITRGGRN